MNPLKAAVVLAVAALQFPAVAGEASPARATSRLWIDGTSTVRAFTCPASKADVFLASGPDVAELSAKGPVERAGSVRVLVKDIDCKDGVMNEHMQNALQAKAHPEIRFELVSFTPTPVDATETPVQLRGNLTIAGATKAVAISAVVKKLPDGGLRVQGRYPVKMSQYGVTPPSLFFGAIKVDDAVTVGFELSFAGTQVQGLRGGPVGRKDCAPDRSIPLERRLARFWEESPTAGLPSGPSREHVALENRKDG